MIIIPTTSLNIIKKTPTLLFFELKPLYPGYGITIGNALRRVLLSSIKGAAITQIKAKGVPHEFSVIPGVKEDLLEIILNLKQVRLKIYGEEPQEIKLDVGGIKKVRAGDIKTPSQVEIVNKDLYLASLTSNKAKLLIEMKAEKGFGYVPAKQLKEKKTRIGAILLDAIFTPVKRVVFKVENIMYEKIANYNNLKMEIETDGSIDPEEVLQEAANILVQQFEKLIPKKIEEKEVKKKKKRTIKKN